MIEFAGRCILLDIEGTTSSIAFVYDVLFPYARQALGPFLESHFDADDTRAALTLIAQDNGVDTFEAWLAKQPTSDPRAAVAAHVHALMDSDVKATGLKQLQGLLWRNGYETGELRSHVYPDVPPAMRRWIDAGLEIRIYSSGSVAAQRLFFAHTEAGDLSPMLSGHYDTTTGPKRERESYVTIAADAGHDPAMMLFVSDVVAELDAARSAGMQTVLSIRPGVKEQTPGPHPSVTTFDSISAKRA